VKIFFSLSLSLFLFLSFVPLPLGESRDSRIQSRPREVVIVAFAVTTVGNVTSILSARPRSLAGTPPRRQAGSHESLCSPLFPLFSWAHSRARPESSRTHTHSPKARTRSRARNTRATHGITGRADVLGLGTFFLEGISPFGLAYVLLFSLLASLRLLSCLSLRLYYRPFARDAMPPRIRALRVVCHVLAAAVARTF